MITITVANVIEGMMPDAYYNSVHSIYIVRDPTRILYIGKAERQSPHARLQQHLAATLDANYRGIDLVPSELGNLIKQNLPESMQWPIDLLTLEDCQSLSGSGQQRIATVDQAERWLIKKYAPLLNRTNKASRAKQPGEVRRPRGNPKALPCWTVEYLGSVSTNGKTQATYRYGLQRFQQFAENTGLATQSVPLEPGRLHRDVLVDFVRWLHCGGAKNNTIRTFVAVVRQYVLWLNANNLVSPDLRVAEMELALERTAGPHMRNLPHEHRHADTTVGQLLKYFANLSQSPFPDTPRGRRQKLACLRNNAIVQTLYATAGRASEVAALPRSSADLIQHTLVNADGDRNAPLLAVDIVGRGGKSRPIFLTLEAMEAIRAYLLARDSSELTHDSNAVSVQEAALFVRHDRSGSSPISEKTVWQMVNAAAKKVFGVDKAGRALKRFGPRDFRHLRAQDLFDNGMPLDTLQAMLGHSSVLTTRRTYGDYPARERLADEIARFGRKPSDTGASK